jgi:hypothetical protein
LGVGWLIGKVVPPDERTNRKKPRTGDAGLLRFR